MPTASSAFSTTTTTLATLTIPAIAGSRICVTGVGFSYDVLSAATLQPALLDGANVMAQVQSGISATFVYYTYPICGTVGNTVSARSSNSGVHTINISLQYFYDP